MPETLPDSPAPAIEKVVLPAVRDLGDGFQVLRALPTRERRMVGPFVFFDQFGPTVFRAGQGLDTRPHPHIGLSTLTYLIQGEIVHRDSAGHVQTIRAGEANWMTAGRGIVHSERSSPQARNAGGTVFGQQIWVALPKALEEIEPSFSHHAAASLPRLLGDGAEITIVAGTGFGAQAPTPVFSDLVYADIILAAGSRLKIPADYVERAIYIVSGSLSVAGDEIVHEAGRLVVFKPAAEIVLKSDAGARVMLVGGEPLPEARHVYWNFVSSSVERIEQAKADWRAQRFDAIVGESEFIPLPPDPPGLAYKG